MLRPEVFEHRLRVEYPAQELAIVVQSLLLLRRDLIELVECNHSHQFRRVDVRAHVQVFEMPDALHDLRRSKHPTTADAAESVSFCQAVGAEEDLRINMER